MPDQIIEPLAEPSEPRRYQCRHIFIAGARCGSPALRHEEFCYYHHTTRRAAKGLRDRRNRMDEFELPPLEDRSSVLAAIAEVLQRIANGGIHTKRAGLLLYGLQIASLNLPKTNPAEQDATPVEQVVVHPRLGHLAPRAIVGAPGEVVEEAEIPEEELSAETKEEVEEERTSRFSVAEVEEMYRRAEAAMHRPKPLEQSRMEQNRVEQNRVPHLRDGLIVAKVGEAPPNCCNARLDEAPPIQPRPTKPHAEYTDYIIPKSVFYKPTPPEETETQPAILPNLQACQSPHRKRIYLPPVAMNLQWTRPPESEADTRKSPTSAQ